VSQRGTTFPYYIIFINYKQSKLSGNDHIQMCRLRIKNEKKNNLPILTLANVVSLIAIDPFRPIHDNF